MGAMREQRTTAPTAPRVLRWAGAALAAASFALAPASASAEIQAVTQSGSGGEIGSSPIASSTRSGATIPCLDVTALRISAWVVQIPPFHIDCST